MASYPHIHLATAAANQQGVKSLADIAIDACIHNQHMLGDVGFVEASHLRRILPHCSRTSLETIEDATLAFSGRDLSWLTWDCWYVIFREAYGPPCDEEYLQLASDPPVDYTPPPGQFAQPADYRSMLLAREALIAARKAAAVERLRAGYNKEAQHREALQVKYTGKVPPAKRVKRGTALMSPPAAPSNGRMMAGKPANKVLHTLGLSKGPSKLAPQHTRKTTASGSSACGTYTWSMSKPKTPAAAAAAAARPVSTLGKPQESRHHQQQQARQQQQQQQQHALQQHQQQQRLGLIGQKRSSSSSSSPSSSGKRPAAGAGLLDTPVVLSRPAAAAAAAVGPLGGAGPSRSTGIPRSGQGCKGSVSQQGSKALLDRPISFGAKR